MTATTERPDWADCIDDQGNIAILERLDGTQRLVLELEVEHEPAEPGDTRAVPEFPGEPAHDECSYSWGRQEKRDSGAWVEVEFGYGVGAYSEPLSWSELWVEFAPLVERFGWTADDLIDGP